MTTQPEPARVYHVSWLVLTRDYQTASSYVGHKVRVRLSKGDYRVESGEVRVFAAENGAPAILVFRGLSVMDQPKYPYPAVTLVGTCRSVTLDGKFRAFNKNYFVTVEESSVWPD